MPPLLVTIVLTAALVGAAAATGFPAGRQPGSQGAEQKPTITREAGTGDYIVDYVVNGETRTLRFTPATQIKPSIVGSVEYDLSSDLYTYQYQFANGQAARQELYRASIQLTFPTEIVGTPAGWQPNHAESVGRISWYRILRGVGREGIPPGSSLSGFAIRSPHLPAPSQARCSGNTGVLEVPGDLPQRVIELLDPLLRQDYLVVPVIAPIIPSGFNEPELTAAVLVSRIRGRFAMALLRADDPDGQVVDAVLGRAVQALDAKQIERGAQYLREARASAEKLDASVWVRSLRDALVLNLDHAQRRFALN
jgi:hypothetical protein